MNLIDEPCPAVSVGSPRSQAVTVQAPDIPLPSTIWRIHPVDQDSATGTSMGEFLGRTGFQLSRSASMRETMDELARSPCDILIASMERPNASIPDADSAECPLSCHADDPDLGPKRLVRL